MSSSVSDVPFAISRSIVRNICVYGFIALRHSNHIHPVLVHPQFSLINVALSKSRRRFLCCVVFLSLGTLVIPEHLLCKARCLIVRSCCHIGSFWKECTPLETPNYWKARRCGMEDKDEHVLRKIGRTAVSVSSGSGGGTGREEGGTGQSRASRV